VDPTELLSSIPQEESLNANLRIIGIFANTPRRFRANVGSQNSCAINCTIEPVFLSTTPNQR
jgi:hypothetical protein